MLPMIDVVMNDVVNQLAVLGIISCPKGEKTSRTKLGVGDEIGEIVKEQREYEKEYDKLLIVREEYRVSGQLSMVAEVDTAIKSVATMLKASTQALLKNMKQNPGDIDNLLKIQNETLAVQRILQETQAELAASGMCSSLVVTIQREALIKKQLKDTITNEAKMRSHVKNLKVQLKETSEEKDRAIFNRNDTIAELKDQLQETKARMAAEGRYQKKEAAVKVAVLQKKKHCG